MDRPFLQTPDWLLFQRHLGRQVWRISDGFVSASIVRYDVRLGQNYLSIPYGPELNFDQGDEGLRNQVHRFVRDVRGLARYEGSMFVRLEPMHDMVPELLIRNGMRLKKSRQALQPRATVVIDLTKTADQLLDGLHHKHRYNINLAERKGITVEESHDAEAFWRMLQKTAEHDDFRTHGHLYYSKLLHFFADPKGSIKVKLYFAYHGGQPVAGVIIVEHGKTAYYLHGASDREHRALMAPHLLHWKIIQQYKQSGYHWYDFWGIDSFKWPGVTRFKLGFGGQVIEYPGAFDLVLKPFWSWLYKIASR
jgi:lipid II:glycine glycyltransferase (peptidoglycan interpeptide bridge formation enzyme)